MGASALLAVGDDDILSFPSPLADHEKLLAAFPGLKGADRAEAALDLLWSTHRPEGLGRAIAEEWSHIPEWRQEDALQSRWEQVRCPEIVPRLEEIASRPLEHCQWHVDHLPSIALARLHEFQPERVREILLNDLARPNPLLNCHALLALPDEALPQLEALWEKVLRGDVDGDLWKVPQLVERYATRGLLPTVVSIAERGWACSMQEALLGYWIKHDRAAGLLAVARAARRRGPRETGCYRSILPDVLPRYWDADTEVLGLSFLADPDLDVATSSANMLLRHGSQECLMTLLDWAARQPQVLGHAVATDVLDRKRFELGPEARELLWDLLGTEYARGRYRESLGR